MGLIEPCSETVTLVRPALLVKAARHAARQHRRHCILGRAGASGGSEKARLEKLRETERDWETLRRQGAPGYRPSIHVRVLAAYLAGAEAAARR